MIKTNVGKLNNELRYVVSDMEGVPSVTVLCLVEAGTRYETPENNGISHFLEHMVFKGTKQFPTTMDIALEVEKVGGIFNAYTGKEYTGYYVKTAVDNMDVAMSVVSQLTMAAKIPSKEIEVERGVILEEIKMYEDLPQNKVGEVFEEIVFKGSTLGWDTLGKPKVIRSVLRKDFKDYMNLLYKPNRMVVSVAGGVGDSKKIEKMIKKYFGEEREQVKLKDDRFEFKQTKARKKIIEKGTEQTHLVYGFRTFGRGNKDRYKLAVMSSVLGGGMSSRLFSEIREKRGLAYYVSSMTETYIEDGYFGVRAGTSKETADQVIELANKEFEKMKNKKVDSKELSKAKEYLKGHMILSMEDSYRVADFYGTDLLMDNKIRSVEEVLENVDKVTASEIVELANQTFVEQKSSLVMIR